MLQRVFRIGLAFIVCVGLFAEMPSRAGRIKDPEATYYPMPRRITVYFKCPTEEDRLRAVATFFGFPLIYTKEDMPPAKKRRQ